MRHGKKAPREQYERQDLRGAWMWHLSFLVHVSGAQLEVCATSKEVTVLPDRYPRNSCVGPVDHVGDAG